MLAGNETTQLGGAPVDLPRLPFCIGKVKRKYRKYLTETGNNSEYSQGWHALNINLYLWI